jgi:hypothetical protein
MKMMIIKHMYGSIISNQAGITEIISLENKLPEYPIKLLYQRGLNNKLNLLKSKSNDEFINVNVWKSYQDKNVDIVKFNIENKLYRNKLSNIKLTYERNWDEILLECDPEHPSVWKLNTYDDNNEPTLITSEFKQLATNLNIHIDDLVILEERGIVSNDNYTLLVNNYIYIVLSDEDEIFDWGIIDIPKFELYKAPVFNITLDNCNIVFGFAVNNKLSFN